MDLIRLYELAQSRGFDIDWFLLQKAESLSIQLNDGSCAIALDPWKLECLADEKVKISHELGHCETGSFYNCYSQFDVRQKHENRADRWAIKKLVPKNELDAAVSAGHTEAWDLAEYFDVTEDFMIKAIKYYKALG